jgi:hypothetical protein
LLLALREELGGLEEDFTAHGRGHQPPRAIRALGCGDRGEHVIARGFLKDADQIVRIGRVAVFKRAAGP